MPRRLEQDAPESNILPLSVEQRFADAAKRVFGVGPDPLPAGGTAIMSQKFPSTQPSLEQMMNQPRRAKVVPMKPSLLASRD